MNTPSNITTTPPEVQYLEDFFTYSTGRGQASSFTNIAPGATGTATIMIEADSYFKWISGAFFSWIEGIDPETTDATRPIPPLLITITDSGSGRNLVNYPTPVSSLYGTGELPFVMPMPRIFQPRSTITFSATNLSSTDTWNLILDHIGVKGFKSTA